MRLGILADRFPPDPGGLACAVDRIARGLVAAGDEVEVHAIVAADAPGAARLEERDGLRVVRHGSHRREEDTAADMFDDLCRRHGERPYDLLHGFYLVRSGPLAAYAGRYLGIPSVVSARGNDLDRSVLDPGRAAPILWSLHRASAVTAVSTDLARKARALAPEARVEVIPNGVDAAAFRPLSRDHALARSLGLDGREVVGFTGELRQKKGMVVLMWALAALAERRPLTLLSVGGVRPDDEGLMALLRRRHPRVHVALLPHREPPALPPLYALMDVFVHPSLRDGLPNAVLEAMACGKPVVASTAGGIPDAVRDGVDGVLVRPGDAEALSGALASVLEDRERARRMGEAGRTRVLAEFSPAEELGRYRSLYAELTAGGRRASGGASEPASR